VIAPKIRKTSFMTGLTSAALKKKRVQRIEPYNSKQEESVIYLTLFMFQKSFFAPIGNSEPILVENINSGAFSL
jgi:hypothetical protein